MEPHYQHQLEAASRLNKFDEYALIMEQGTGKSRPILDDWMRRVTDGRADDLVIIAPKGCYLNWIGTLEEPGEIFRWIPKSFFEQMTFGAWIRGVAAHRDNLRDLLHATKPRFLTMNVEALNREGNAREYLQRFIGNRKVIGCIDESTTIAHEDAKRTQFILNILAQKFTTRRILSGLVAPESPMDLFSQYQYLNWQIIGQRNFYTFRNRYAIVKKVMFVPAALQ